MVIRIIKTFLYSSSVYSCYLFLISSASVKSLPLLYFIVPILAHPWKKSYDQPRQHIKKQRHYFVNKGLSSQSYGFSSSHVWMWELDYKESCAKELMLLNCGVGEDSLRIPWTARRSNHSILKEISPEYSLEGLMLKLKLHYLATWCEELTYLKSPWCWERLKLGAEGDDRGWNGWMASPTQWTWVWVGSRSWWWTGRPSMLQSMGSQRVGHDWVTELNWTEWESTH